MDDFSQKTADQLFARFPEWRKFARVEKSDDGRTFLIVEVPAPSEANVEHGLIIDTAGAEVTVSFDAYHCHFDSWTGDGDHFGTTAAGYFVEQLVTERIAVVSWWNDETWRGSGQVEAGAPSGKPFGQDFNRTRVRSWKGTLNADIHT